MKYVYSRLIWIVFPKNRKINKIKSFYKKGGQIRLDIRHTWSILPNFELSALSSDFTHTASFLSPFRIIEWTSEIIVVARNNNRCNNNRCILILDRVQASTRKVGLSTATMGTAIMLVASMLLPTAFAVLGLMEA